MADRGVTLSTETLIIVTRDNIALQLHIPIVALTFRYLAILRLDYVASLPDTLLIRIG
jgi:hypothetical protein